MVRSLLSFRQLTRSGLVPEMKVCSCPIVTVGIELKVGEVVPAGLFRPIRIRQLYEQRRIEPVVPPLNSRQAAIAKHNAAAHHTALASAVASVPTDPEPVSSLPFDAPPIDAVEEEQDHSSISVRPSVHKAKVAYRPRRGVTLP